MVVKPKAKTDKPKRAMPAFTKAPEGMVEKFERAMKDFPMVTQRKMFGYPAAFVNGNMFAGLFQQEMFLRLSDEDRAAIRKEMAHHSLSQSQVVRCAAMCWFRVMC